MEIRILVSLCDFASSTGLDSDGLVLVKKTSRPLGHPYKQFVLGTLDYCKGTKPSASDAPLGIAVLEVLQEYLRDPLLHSSDRSTATRLIP